MEERIGTVVESEFDWVGLAVWAWQKVVRQAKRDRVYKVLITFSVLFNISHLTLY